LLKPFSTGFQPPPNNLIKLEAVALPQHHAGNPHDAHLSQGAQQRKRQRQRQPLPRQAASRNHQRAHPKGVPAGVRVKVSGPRQLSDHEVKELKEVGSHHKDALEKLEELRG
jgi:hypothetical protein